MRAWKALALLLALALIAPPVGAYIGVSGDFYAHTYYVPIGGEVSGATVVINNPSNQTIHVRMVYQVNPPTKLLTVEFSQEEFDLKPGESKTIYITLKAAPNCPPGNYTVIVGGEEIIKVGNESVASPSGALKARVVVTGKSGKVIVRAVDINGNPVPVTLILYSLPSKYPIKKSTNGTIEAVVASGKYLAQAYLAGQLLNSTEFTVNTGETKVVEMVVHTVYFISFDVAPAKNSKGEIGYAYIFSTVRNLFKPLKNARLVLSVKYNGKPLENVSVATIPVLPLNDTEFKYNYIPKDGWKAGTYTFQMMLYSGKTLYAETKEVSLKVTPEMVGESTSTSSIATSGGRSSTAEYVGIGLAVVAVGLLAVFLRGRSPLKVTDVKVSSGGVEVLVQNGSKRDAMLLNVRVLALPSKVEIASIRKPKTSDGSTKVRAGSSAKILIPDEDGSIRGAYESGGILVRVETNVGVAEKKVSS